jgi:hypothetical protein
VSSGSIDGSLVRWEEIADAAEWQALLLGNGLSIEVWPKFDYGSLYEHAQDGTLTKEDRALFGDTSNFERVLADLNVAIRICDSLGIDTAPLYARYRSIQRALGHAIREVHLMPDPACRLGASRPLSTVPDASTGPVAPAAVRPLRIQPKHPPCRLSFPLQ